MQAAMEFKSVELSIGGVGAGGRSVPPDRWDPVIGGYCTVGLQSCSVVDGMLADAVFAGGGRSQFSNTLPQHSMH